MSTERFGKRIALTRVGDTEVSTVRTPNWVGPLMYETCLFRDNGESDAVGHCDTEAEALSVHIFWVNKLLDKGHPMDAKEV